jgi:hypothetical protein
MALLTRVLPTASQVMMENIEDGIVETKILGFLVVCSPEGLAGRFFILSTAGGSFFWYFY